MAWQLYSGNKKVGSYKSIKSVKSAATMHARNHPTKKAKRAALPKPQPVYLCVRGRVVKV